MSPSHVDVIVFQEHCRREENICVSGRRGQEMFLHAGKEIIARKTAPHRSRVGCHQCRVRVLDQHRLDRRPSHQGIRIAVEDRTNAGLVEDTRDGPRPVPRMGEGRIEIPDVEAGEIGAAATMLPRTTYRRQAASRVHVRSAVSASSKPDTEAQESPLRASIKPREIGNGCRIDPGDFRRPFRRSFGEMRPHPVVEVGVLRQIRVIRQSLGQHDVHNRAGQRTVRSGPQDEANIRRGHRRRPVYVDHGQLRATQLACLLDVTHQVDVSVNRIAAPNHDQVGLLDFHRVDAPLHANTCLPTGDGGRDANRSLHAGMPKGPAQPLHTEPLHDAERPARMIRPDRFGPVCLGCHAEGVSYCVESFIPADPLEPAFALRTHPPHRLGETIRVMDPFGIPADLLADNAGSEREIGISANAPDERRRESFDFQCAGAWTIVRAGGTNDLGGHGQPLK